MDANWGLELSGVTILKKFLAYDADTKVIFVTASFEAMLVNKMKNAGVKGYFYRNVDDVNEIAKCITGVYASNFYFVSNS